MCMAVFIAAAEPLPFIAWNAAAPAFHLQAIPAAEDGVRSRLAGPHVYFLGAHTGCSCGFNYGLRDVRNAEDQAEEAASRASVAALRLYLRQAVLTQGDVELWSTWDEDATSEPEQRLDVTPDWFDGETFAMPEKVLFRVTAA